MLCSDTLSLACLRWKAVFDDMKTEYGIDVAFWAIFLDFGQRQSLAEVTWAAGAWGSGADVLRAAGYVSTAATLRGEGKAVSHPVWWGDARPYASKADESLATAAGRAYLDAMVDGGADVAFDVWSDYREGRPTRPGVASGYNLGDLRRYWLHRWKTGAWPTIVKDVVYLSHRNQLLSTPLGNFRSGQTKRMVQWTGAGRGSPLSTPADVVEALTFLTAAADVVVDVCGTQYTYSAPAGLFAKTYTLSGTGSVSVTVRRNNVVTASIQSPFVVTTTPFHDEYNYFLVSSARGVGVQFDLDASLAKV